ncbi:MAG: alpha/beta fold hydrolase [Pseudonocardiaceae bacterium]|nr:alpha/beta fold hydrolase [Pseudonocardiaceae bacterium]
MLVEHRRSAGGDFVTADGTWLHVTEHGKRDAPLTVVLAHGWTLDERTWAPVVRALSGDDGLRLVTYEHRGHGRSDPATVETSTITQLGDDLAELLTDRIDGPVILAGHSLGGMAIMSMAERHPELIADRVAGVAFIATSCCDLMPCDLGLKPAVARLVAAIEVRLMRSEMLARWMRKRAAVAHRARMITPGVRWLLFGDDPRREDIELTARCVAQSRSENIVNFVPTLDEHDCRAALATFADTPALVLCGVRDRLTALRHTQAIAMELPHARTVTYRSAGHMVPLERAEQVAGRISELARECDVRESFSAVLQREAG